MAPAARPPLLPSDAGGSSLLARSALHGRMAGDFQGFTLEKAEQLSGRLREVLSGGQAYILARLGLDMGLEPDLYSTWLVLSATAVLLLLLLAVSWASVRGVLLLGKTATSRVDPPTCVPDKAASERPEGAEEPRKRNKRRTAEKVHGWR